MARTHRAHLSPSKLSKRGPDRKEREPKPVQKTHKQQRPNERAKLKKEYL